ncbi:hypothetical protein DLAC_08709 [Tieghemostelium lacteum]|uniref:tRNAHis guanylyltransferase catalytic domain-containing protein n=1 Tax=Tieghemostelium lacteum TaxID=361077 RepID=A0A151Z8J5_TIELA|nr:hypothetical protein DLAC_08709 [Tieghemostelium lacteum]|eukprot:KYQ90124.1 hypothetical protein DLAC_08709 [Tieghemostelium lacteum]
MSHPKEILGDRMKQYENNVNNLLTIQPGQSFIIRLDGHGFSKFTKSFVKPWDIRIHNAMIETATELFKSFNPYLIYTFSDEITMCFPAIQQELTTTTTTTTTTNTTTTTTTTTEATESTKLEDKDIYPAIAYSGKIQKLVTLSAGLASTVFYKSIMKQAYEKPKDNNLIDKLDSATPHFDSRIFIVPNHHEIIQNLIWRSCYDCARNSVSGLAQAHFSHKSIFGLALPELKKKLLTEKNIDFEAEPDWYKYGVFIKKQYYNLQTVNPKTNEPITALRSKFRTDSFNINHLIDAQHYLTQKCLPLDYNLSFRT